MEVLQTVFSYVQTYLAFDFHFTSCYCNFLFLQDFIHSAFVLDWKRNLTHQSTKVILLVRIIWRYVKFSFSYTEATDGISCLQKRRLHCRTGCFLFYSHSQEDVPFVIWPLIFPLDFIRLFNHMWAYPVRGENPSKKNLLPVRQVRHSVKGQDYLWGITHEQALNKHIFSSAQLNHQCVIFGLLKEK